jgi:hypothetical protein
MSPPHMIFRAIELSGYGSLKRVDVSVPLVEQLVDGVKYFRPGDAKPLERAAMYSYRANPAQIVHDRRAKTVSRGSAGYIVEAEVTDPYDPAAKVAVVRSVRNDTLGDRHARGFIDDAQLAAGRRFQELFEAAERGPRSAPIAERVNGTPPYEGLTDSQIRAHEALARAYKALGLAGSALVLDILVRCMTTRQIAASRGLSGKLWENFYAKRFEECLETLAQTFGLVTAR